MAFKSFKKLSPRNQSSTISQLHKLIKYYGEIFCPRERSYLKELSKQDRSIYWVEDESKKLVAAAIVEPKYIFDIEGHFFKTLGYTVSKRPGQMERIFSHILDDYEEDNLIFMCRKSLASSLQTEKLGMVKLTSTQLMEFLPELAYLKTDYFNVKNEPLALGMERRQNDMFLKLNDEARQDLLAKKPKLLDILQ
jgi:hypothetical protein